MGGDLLLFYSLHQLFHEFHVIAIVLFDSSRGKANLKHPLLEIEKMRHDKSLMRNHSDPNEIAP